jgi:hypothetical protein
MHNKLFAEIIFWLHLVIFLVWIGLFFVPYSVWQTRVVFHFWYVATLIASQLIMGLILRGKMHKFRIVCPLTSLMQWLRGYAFGDAQNYDHSFVREFAERLKIRIRYGVVGFLIFLSFGILIYQYIVYVV